MQERNTKQKSLIYDVLCCMANHPTAEAVCAEVHRRNPGISRATVYRVLNQFTESGKILKVPVRSGADHYDHQTHQHYHICCSRCGKVVDVETAYIADLEKSVGESCGYVVTGCTVQFDGICPECRRQVQE